MGQGSGLNLENVVGHLPGRDASTEMDVYISWCAIEGLGKSPW